MVHECEVLTAPNKKICYHSSSHKRNSECKLYCFLQKGSGASFHYFLCISASSYYSKLWTFFHFSLWLAKLDWDLKATTILDDEKRLCSTNRSLIKDVFSQAKRPLDFFTVLHQVSVTLSCTVLKFCFCLEQPYGWILHFTSHDLFTAITRKLVLKYQY